MPDDVIPEPIEIEPRDRRHDFSDVPKAWHAGQLSVSLFFDALAVSFPLGERFFVRSVKLHKDRIVDETLKKDVAAFCAQEGHHGREHERYNAMLRAHGLPVDVVERRIGRLLGLAQRDSEQAQLAVTCALEHFTAMLGVLVLGDKTALAGAHPTMAALWKWHAAEENEHKAVAFDVYRAVYGTGSRATLIRRRVMFMTTLFFWIQLVVAVAAFMRQERVLFSAKEHIALLRYLFTGDSSLALIVRPYLRYYARDFHPDNDDSDDLVRAWRREEEGVGAH